ncbi:MAG: bifunctional folylpolyglutamate synthase/dihydrofolate synthase [Planctomycetes bacterium]|nr:bifunctional folylpolyglutamate synthase/dihydrofolate synthase [Planctomycetota bacterium]
MVTATSDKKTSRAKSASGAFRRYDAALKYLFSMTDYEQMLRVRYNRDTFSLDRMFRLLKGLGDPQDRIRTVHIAGTKGKGSTVEMLSQMLIACGYKVGVYTSPHIVDIRERIRINHTMISQAALTRLISTVEPIIEQMGDDKPTFFEIFTSLAFMYFANEAVDVAVIETGLGGRLDSTNVLKPDVCGLTSISLDHMHQLGRTVGLIAKEKAGIFKPDIPAVSVPQRPEVEAVLRSAAKASKTPLMFAGKEIDFSYRFESSRATGPQTRVCMTTETSNFEHLPVPLLGEHQALNCGLALALLDELKKKGFDRITDATAVEGLRQTYLPGRMEMVCRDPRMIADGAHNAASVAALMKAIGQNIPYDSMVVVFGCAVDKDIPGMMRELALGADKIVFTSAGGPRAAKTRDLADAFEECTGKTAQVANSVEEALAIAASAVSREDIICATGSFYLVGAVKQILAARQQQQAS